MSTPLERRYRLLLRAYPPRYRAERGDEIVGVLLDLAPPGRTRPTVADAADLVGNGLRRRLRLPIVDGLTAGLTLAAPVALALAAGLAAFLWAWLEVVGGLHTTGPVTYAPWLAAAAAYTLGRTGAARTLALVGTVAALVLPGLGAVTTVDRPPLWVSMVLGAFGVITVAGIRGAASGDERLAVGAGSPVVAVCATALTAAAGPAAGPASAYYQPTIARFGLVVAVAVAVHAATAGVRLVLGRPARAWLWATVLLALPGGWLGPFGDAGVGVADPDVVHVVPHFGRLAQVLLTTCVVGVAVAWLMRAGPAAYPGTGRAVRTRPARAAGGGWLPWVAVGGALGLAAVICVLAFPVYLAYATPLPRRRALYVALTVVLLVVTAVARAIPAWVALAAPTRPRAVLATTVGTLVAAVAAWLVAVYDNVWTLRHWAHPDLTANLVTTLALVPFGVFAVLAAPSVGLTVPGAAAGSVTRADRLVGWWTLLASAAWLSYTTVPHLLSWGPVVLLLVAGLLALVFTTARPRTGPFGA